MGKDEKSRDPNVAPILHDRFEALEARLKKVEEKVGISLKDAGEAAGEIAGDVLAGGALEDE